MQHEISIIIEWENVLLAEQDRCITMLQEVRRQILASKREIEVLVIFNPQQVDRNIVEQALVSHLLPVSPSGREITCRIAEGEGLHYYQLKNRGVQLSNGQIIIFIDSDVIPESGWLEALIKPFEEFPGMNVLAGHTYLAPDDLPGQAFALGWFFPLRSTIPALESGAKHFFANNVAFRREILEQYPFPEMASGMTRGACVTLASTLVEHGIDISKTTAAQCSHPAPNGFEHFFARGLAEGRDWAIKREQECEPRWRSSLAALKKFFSNTRRTLKRGIKFHRNVGLSWWQTPLAIGLMSLFHLEACLGTWAYLLMPESARRWWRI
ncbi:glycosyltransferase [Azonexus sp.]|uniref:glycosyltransferase family A protein n=1 Tax=Azonexus sp. TaxID=1872668 RepID=UPI0035B2C7B4